jgi:hypothetical protein
MPNFSRERCDILSDMFWLEHHKRANHVEFGRAQLGVGFLVVDISDDSGHACRKLGHGRLPAIEHRDLVPGSNGLTDGSKRYLAGTPTNRTLSATDLLLQISFIGIETDTDQHPVQDRVEYRQCCGICSKLIFAVRWCDALGLDVGN